jgi:cell division protein FtsQ
MMAQSPLLPPPPTTMGNAAPVPAPGATLRRARKIVAPVEVLQTPLQGAMRWARAPAVWGSLLAGLCVVVLAIWATHSPVFNIEGFEMEGRPLAAQRANGDPSVRTSLEGIRAALPTQLAGNFFTVDLAAARRNMEALPWVRRAEVRRVWPNRLAVRLEEHQLAAVWEGAAGTQRLVNRQGEVFDAELSDAEEDAVPTLAGPEGSAAQVHRLWQRLSAVFAAHELPVERLALSGRGSWRADLKGGALIELGRGSDEEVTIRSERFLRTVGDLTQRYQQPFEYADLRHSGGYALRLAGGVLPSAGAAAAVGAAGAAGAAGAGAGTGPGAGATGPIADPAKRIN